MVCGYDFGFVLRYLVLDRPISQLHLDNPDDCHDYIHVRKPESCSALNFTD